MTSPDELRDLLAGAGELRARLIVPSAVIAAWLASVADGSWSWVRNTRCKYVKLGIDTKRGAYLVNDRDDVPISADELLWQYGQPALSISPSRGGVSMETVEIIARLLVKQRSADPDTFHQIYPGEPWPVDATHAYVDLATGQPREMLMTRAWRRRVGDAQQIIAVLAHSIPDTEERKL